LKLDSRMEELSRSFFLVGEICLFSDTPDVALTWANLLVRVLHIFGEKVFTNKQSLLDRSKELLEKKQLDHTRGAGVIFWSHLFDVMSHFDLAGLPYFCRQGCAYICKLVRLLRRNYSGASSYRVWTSCLRQARQQNNCEYLDGSCNRVSSGHKLQCEVFVLRLLNTENESAE
jgi:hypothetical protein